MQRLQWQKNCFTVVRFIAGRKRLRQGNLLIQIYPEKKNKNNEISTSTRKTVNVLITKQLQLA